MTTTHFDNQDEIRTIETHAPPTRFARGWHCLGLVTDLRDGKPHAFNAFGTKLVVFADTRGDLKVLNGYCPHMGGDLTKGTVKGDEIACPFHDWRWSGDGRCAEIPYAKRVPPLARTKSWITLERNGMLFVWNDPQGNTPPPEVTIPEIEGYGTPEWTSWTWNSVTIEGSHSREIVDNLVDMAHFFYVHYAMPVYFKNVFEGHVAAQFSHSKPRPDVDGGEGYSTGEGPDLPNRAEATYHGPAYNIDYETIPTEGDDMKAALVLCHYPVTSTSFVLQWGVMVKKIPGLDEEQTRAVVGAFSTGLETGFLQDIEIWRGKTKIDNPLLCEADGPVYQLRRWYEQFYVDIEDVTPDMTQRFEFEIDTERAKANWQREIADNIAAGREILTKPKAMREDDPGRTQVDAGV